MKYTGKFSCGEVAEVLAELEQIEISVEKCVVTGPTAGEVLKEVEAQEDIQGNRRVEKP